MSENEQVGTPVTPMTPITPASPLHYVVAELDSSDIVIGLYTTKSKDFEEKDFKIRRGEKFSYNGYFDALGRPLYKVTDVPVISSRPILDEEGEQVFADEIQSFPVFEQVPVLDENGNPLVDVAGEIVTEEVQVFETVIVDGVEIQVPKMEERLVSVPQYEEYEKGTKRAMILRTKEELESTVVGADPALKALQLSGAMTVMEIAQHNKELDAQKMTNAQLLIEVSKLKAQLETLQGGGE